MSVEAAASSGDRRRVLEALRGVLAVAVDAATPVELAPLARQLAAVTRELDELPAARGSTVDELAERAARRRAGAAGP